MKISDVIKELQSAQNEFGDLEVSINEIVSGFNVGKLLLNETSITLLDSTLQFYGELKRHPETNVEEFTIRNGIRYKDLGKTLHLSLHS
jgi:hypothetical protein